MESLLLNVYVVKQLDPASSKTVGILLTVAKVMIALKWCDNKPPSLSLCQNKFMEYFMLSKLEFFTTAKSPLKVFKNSQP